jgi:tRNA 2-selenouridine synthase
MELRKTDIEKFLLLAEEFPVVDVRSPKEFSLGHIPGAVNIYLFTDKERESVGIKFKKEGRIQAVIEGLNLTGPSMASKLKQALDIAGKSKILVHCWRGGMRSEVMAWLFSLGGIETEILEGGYKAYRHYILESLSERRKSILLGGMTGSGKTEILKYLKKSGEQVIDLEGIANHKGSAFGWLGQSEQPSTEHFVNILFDDWKRLNKQLPLWLEDESRNIGKIFLPESLYLNMQESPVIILLMDIELRLLRLIKEYSDFHPDSLKSSIMKISKRLGGDKTKEAINAVEKGDFASAIRIVLHYYDKAYMHSLERKNQDNIILVKTDTDDTEINAQKVLEASGQLRW